jgi:hypothetical protein
MTKLKAWHKSLIAILITATIIAAFGPRKLLIYLILVYVILFPTIYLIERKKKLTFWQERLIVSLIVFPLLSLFIPTEDVLYLFIGSLIAGGIIFFLSGKGKDQDSEGKDNQIEEASRNKT